MTVQEAAGLSKLSLVGTRTPLTNYRTPKHHISQFQGLRLAHTDNENPVKVPVKTTTYWRLFPVAVTLKTGENDVLRD